MSKFASNIMATIITDELAKNLTWVALIKEKTRISDKFFISLIVGKFLIVIFIFYFDPIEM